ncbi:MAG: ComEA family DNA-binding protein [bacterium]
MNRKERLAAAILVATLAAGIVIDIVGREADEDIVDLTEAATAPGGQIGPAAPGADTAGVEAVGGEVGPAGGRSDGAEDGDYRRIDINKACLEELVLLPGIGPKKAEAVIEWRSRMGPFGSIEGLLEVRGIGPGTLERLRPYICVGG